MTPFWDNGITRLYQADAREIPLADHGVHCCVTSPPYFGLRKYKGVGDRGIGLEDTLEEYLANLLEVFREVARVLRPDGVLFLNLGDAYYSGAGEGGSRGARPDDPKSPARDGSLDGPNRRFMPGFVSGDRLGIPERVVIALQEDGWIWRDTAIWTKPSPMPSSVHGTRWVRHRIKIRSGAVPRHGIERGVGHVNESDVGGRRCQKNDDHTDHRKAGINDCTQPPPRGREPWRLGANPDKPQQDHDGDRFSASALWQDCPGCPQCEPGGGYVLSRGSWRTTQAHEYIYMLTRSMRYYADGEAVKTPLREGALLRAGQNQGSPRWDGNRRRDSTQPPQTIDISRMAPPSGANRRSVWDDIKPEPYPGDHYAVFPSGLPRICIQIGASDAGVCPECGAQWARVVNQRPSTMNVRVRDAKSGSLSGKSGFDTSATDEEIESYGPETGGESETVGWRPTCGCGFKTAVPATVLDPFAGTATTCLAAQRLGRRSVGVELSESSLKQAVKRLSGLSLPLELIDA